MATIRDRTTAFQNGTVDETTPLIASESALEAGQNGNGEADGQDPDSKDSEKLPVVQIMLLCFARIAEPIAFFSIFAFIGEMIEDAAGVTESEVGFYSGLIESIFSFVQMLLMIPWGRAADKFGRKPVLVISMAGMSAASALFGTSHTIWEMIMYRSIAGMFSGTIVAVRASISENSTPKTQARAFSYFAFSNNLGIVLASFMGGVLSRPADKYPSVFGGVQFFKDNPYALATFTTGAIGGIACIVSALFIKETLRKTPQGDANGSAPKTMTTTDIMKAPGVSQVLFVYAFTMLLALAYTASKFALSRNFQPPTNISLVYGHGTLLIQSLLQVVPIFYYTSVDLGGYGLSDSQIAMFLGIAGLSQAVWLLFVFPRLHWRIGTGGVLRLCASAWPVWFVATPAANYLLRLGLETTFWTIAPFLLVVGSGVAMAFTACQLAINDISPSPETLGTVNAISLTLNSGLRAVAPALFSILFATGVKEQIFKGYLAWLILVILAIGYRGILLWLPARAEGKINSVEVDDTDE
ncbi:uncharacterized protein BHQ10_005585 [Talaromyces amestolkiae]|uniref:Major facilitator superfamily (MFS) profile domain-containing protein n=1 Tax=Talaromyces amestolkiae TaxID=1196081 RepID=A0A364L181_TALAM|nr:uncharacterized protein BHQ10_005585 [Talaromyces amestolkiae]RAO69573.1 hypothetical protein BHQ10_005585 [Talaromyces amestolkiae]